MVNKNIAKLIYGERSTSPKLEFSIVIPTFRRAKYLRRTIMSAIHQIDYNKPYEIIVVNNDNSECQENIEVRELLQGITEEYDNLVYYENNSNVGMYENWNVCIQLAQGDWICICHDDDVMSSKMLFVYNKIIHLSRYKKMAYVRVNFVSYDIEKIDLENSRLDTKHIGMKLEKISTFDYIISGSHATTAPPSCGTLLRKSAALDVGGFKNDYYPSSDAYFIYELNAKYKIYRTISKMGVYGIGVNETFKEGVREKFIDEDIRQLNDMCVKFPRCRHFIIYFFTQILYSHHKINVIYPARQVDYTVIPKDKLGVKSLIKLYIYQLIKIVYFKTKKIICVLFR